MLQTLNSIKQCLNSKTLIGFCVIALLGLQLTAATHSHEDLSSSFEHDCFVCHFISFADDDTLPNKAFISQGASTPSVALSSESLHQYSFSFQPYAARAPPSHA